MKFSAPDIQRASIANIAVDTPGHVPIARQGTRNVGADPVSYDGYVTETHDATPASPTFTSVAVGGSAPLMPNGSMEPVETFGIAFGPDHTPWATFSRDTCRHTASEGCDGNFTYANTSFAGTVVHLAATG